MSLLRVVWPLVAIQLILMAVCLRDLARRKPHEVRGGKRWVWALVIVCISTLGPVIYLAWGRRDQ